jgi:hypothetical protein
VRHPGSKFQAGERNRLLLNHSVSATEACTAFRSVGHVESQQVGYLMPSQRFEERLEATLHSAHQTGAVDLNVAHTCSPANMFDWRSTDKAHLDSSNRGLF